MEELPRAAPVPLNYSAPARRTRWTYKKKVLFGALLVVLVAIAMTLLPIWPAHDYLLKKQWRTNLWKSDFFWRYD
jgi:hypothetical protein